MAARGCGRVGSGASAAGPGPRPVMRRGLCLARRRHQGIVSCPRCRTASRRPRATRRYVAQLRQCLSTSFASLQRLPTGKTARRSGDRTPAKSGDRQNSGQECTRNRTDLPPCQTHAVLQRVEESTGGFRARLLHSSGLRPPRRRRHQPFIRRLVTWQRTVAWPRRCRHRAATSAIAPTPTPRASELSPCSTRLAVLESCSTLASTLTCNTASSAATCRAGPQPAPSARVSSRRPRLRCFSLKYATVCAPQPPRRRQTANAVHLTLSSCTTAPASAASGLTTPPALAPRATPFGPPRSRMGRSLATSLAVHDPLGTGRVVTRAS